MKEYRRSTARTPEPRLAVGESEAAQMLGISARNLWSLRVSGNGPRHRRAGRRVLYAVADLHAWLEQGHTGSTT